MNKLFIVAVSSIVCIMGFFHLGCDTTPTRSQQADTGMIQAENALPQETTSSESDEQQGEPLALRCVYRPGMSETVRYNNETRYKSWVEMPNKPASHETQRRNYIELLMQRQIESVDPDGSAVMKVTIKEAKITVDITIPKRNKQESYLSTEQNTQSTWNDQPVLAGAEYRIKVAPDTTIIEIMDLDALKQRLKITDPPTNLVSVILSEEGIRKVHQREFVQAAPDPVHQGQPYEKLCKLPDVMIKAQAIKKVFQAAAVDAPDGRKSINVDISGEPVYVLPKGFPSPPKPTDIPQMMIKNSSDMQDLTIKGQGRFDPTTGRSLLETNTIDCLLVLLEESISEKNAKDEYGVMFTLVAIRKNFEVVQ